ncbi:MAG TPA: homoserine dehydrogenase [Verrucomicrobiae bacterium]|jgi:homoserine dehydrogenase
MRRVNIGMIGGGTVGSGVYHHLRNNGPLLESRLGLKLGLAKVAVKAFDEPRAYPIEQSLMTTDWATVVNDPKVDIIIELVGGINLAKTMILAALKLGKPVITANKALISAHGQELFAAAAQYKTNVYYEASVAGGIPIIKALREGFVGNRITNIYGIVNGTCNYILTRMKLEKSDFEPTLHEAQRLGYAEADPSLDIDGFDSEHKIGILASLAHGFWVDPSKIYVEGIRSITRTDIEFAGKLGYTIKLLGVVKSAPGQAKKSKAIQVSVYPALVPNEHVLASVNHVFNAVFVRGDVVGDTLFYGRGAGKDATASAVLSDIADAALDLKHGTCDRVPPFVPHDHEASVLPIDQVVSRYYLRLNVVDKPGTLAKVAAILAANKIGISSVIQPEGHEGQSVPLILMIHDAPNSAMRKALAKISKLPVVKGPPVMLRVENFDQ